MHADLLLNTLLSDVLPSMHSKRFRTLSAVVKSALDNNLTVTSLGRGITSQAQERNNIKRADRLMSNNRLKSERIGIYRSASKHLLGDTKRPIILVDWSDINEPDELFLLRASTPVGGRSLTIYEEVYDRTEKEKNKTHQSFLNKLSTILQSDCKPILVTDAGFRTPWFKLVEKLGWDWVARVRNRNLVNLASEQVWKPCKSLYELATVRPKKLGAALLTKKNAIECNLVIYKAKQKGRIKKNASGERAQSFHSKKHAAREREPWLLATSLEDTYNLSKKVVKIYKTRMQIEESFRDLKSARFGMGLEYSKTYTEERLEILIMIGSLAAMIVWSIGEATKIIGIHKHYQAHLIKGKKEKICISNIFLGMRVVRDKNFFKFRVKIVEFKKVLKQALKKINIKIQEYAYDY